MRKTFILVGVGCLPLLAAAQDSLISHRAMNLFLADRIGYYLSAYHDISFDKNYVTFSSLDGEFSLNHNFFQAKGGDQPVRAFTVGGIKANIVNDLGSAFKGEQFPDEIGVTVVRTWIAPARTRATPSQKRQMDALRAGILYRLQAEMAAKRAEFEKVLDSLKPTDVPGQVLDSAKALLRRSFDNDQSEYWSWESARRQSDLLINTANYDLVSTSWTSIYGYVPILPQNYRVADSPAGPFKTASGYPAAVTISHTRFLESRTAGRFFLTLAAGVSLNNSVHSLSLEKTGPSDYVGTFKNFFTPVVKVQGVWFPPDSHVGFNLGAEQHFGDYPALNGVIGIPIVLIDKAGHPAANFQFQCRFFDLTGKILPNESVFDKASVGLTVAVPFSRIIY